MCGHELNKAAGLQIMQIIAACNELGRISNEPYNPPVTFVVAQKRHNTRFFPIDQRTADRSGNVVPGAAACDPRV